MKYNFFSLVSQICISPIFFLITPYLSITFYLTTSCFYFLGLFKICVYFTLSLSLSFSSFAMKYFFRFISTHLISIRCSPLAHTLPISLLSPSVTLPVRPHQLSPAPGGHAHQASLQTPIQALEAPVSPLRSWLPGANVQHPKTPVLRRYQKLRTGQPLCFGTTAQVHVLQSKCLIQGFH